MVPPVDFYDVNQVLLGDLISPGDKRGPELAHSFDPKFIDLSQFLWRNGLAKGDDERGDPRGGVRWMSISLQRLHKWGNSEKKRSEDSVDNVLQAGKL